MSDTIDTQAAPAAQPAPAAKPTDIVQAAEQKVEQIVVGVENVLHTVEIKVEAGWTWVEGEIVELRDDALKVQQWVQDKDPQLAALLRQKFLVLEQDAVNIAKAKIGPLGNLVTATADTLETNAAQFAQGLFGGNAGSLTAQAGAMLLSQGETMLLSMLKVGLAKAGIAALIPAL